MNTTLPQPDIIQFPTPTTAAAPDDELKQAVRHDGIFCLMAMLYYPESRPLLASRLHPHFFTDLAAGVLWRVSLDLHNEGKAITPLIAYDAVGKDDEIRKAANPRSRPYLASANMIIAHAATVYQDMERNMRTVTAAEIEQRAQIFVEGASRLMLIGLMQEAVTQLANPCNVTQAIGALTSRMEEIAARTELPYMSGKDMGELLFELAERGMAGDMRPTPTGIASLDPLIGGGIGKRELAVLAGGTGTGKTTLALQIALNISQAAQTGGGQVLYYSLEMTKEQLTIAAWSILTNTYKKKLVMGEMDAGECTALTRLAGELAQYQIDIKYAPTMTTLQLVAEAQAAHHRRPVKLIVVDGLWLLGDNIADKTEKVKMQVMALSQLAKRTGATVLALSQYYGAVQAETVGMNDLRGGGFVGYHPDLVIALARDGDETIAKVLKNRLLGNTGETATLIWEGTRYA